MDFRSVVTRELRHTHTDPLLALIFGLGFPQQTPENPQKISKLYQNPEFSRTFFCNYRPADLYTQTLPLLHADPIEL